MRSIHLLIPDLFLPQPVCAEACADLALPALLTLLARAQPSGLQPESLEAWLCDIFCVADQAIAPVTLRADSLDPGASYWLCADPVYLHLQRDQLILQAGVSLTSDEATQLCASLNAHFVEDGLRFFAPHPQRWYLQLDAAPEMNTHHLAQVVGRDVNGYLPQGADALHWHGVFNEIQMLLFEHAVNQAREARGELPVNSVWLWGGGRAIGKLARPYDKMYGDSDLANAFAQAAGMHYAAIPNDISQCVPDNEGVGVLMVWEGLRHALQEGDIHAWRENLLRFEYCCAGPLLDALRAGRIDRLTLDVTKSGNPQSSKQDVELTLPQTGASRRFVLTRAAAWMLWRRSKPLAAYAA